MKKLAYIFLVLIFSGINAQTDLDLENKIQEADRLAFSNPDSALLVIRKLEAKIDDDRLKSKLLLAKGSAYSVKHLSSAALKSGFEAYEISQKAKDSLMMINSLGFIGNQYYILRLNKKAMNYLNRAESNINQLNDKAANQAIANTYFVKALVYKDNLDPAFAIMYFDKAIKEYEKLRSESSITNKNTTKIQKAYSLLDLKEPDKAEAIFLEVIDEAQENNITEIVNYAKIGLAITFENRNEYIKANEILLSVEKQIGNSSNIGMLTEIYEALCQNYYDQNNAGQFYYYSKKLEKFLLQNNENEIKSFAELAIKNVETKETELNDSQRMFYLTVFLIVFGGIVSLFFIYRKIITVESRK